MSKYDQRKIIIEEKIAVIFALIAGFLDVYKRQRNPRLMRELQICLSLIIHLQRRHGIETKIWNL